MKFEPIDLSISDLSLDPHNPRFLVPPNADESSLIDYLLEYEDVEVLARSIISFGGLMPGERIIVCEENGRYIVLEGNRRVTACKLLLDNNLVPTRFQKKFPKIDENSEFSLNIKVVNVDLVPNRESAQSTLYYRHLEGVKNWQPLSKNKFFANEFRKGKTIKEISDLTKSKPGNVKKGIREHNFIVDFVLNLGNWNLNEKAGLDIQKIKITPFLRVFSANSPKFGVNATTLLQMGYDEQSLKPISKLNKKVFEEGIYLIARAAFFNKEFSTRQHVEDIPDFMDFIQRNLLFEMKGNVSSETAAGSYVEDGIVNTSVVDHQLNSTSEPNPISTIASVSMTVESEKSQSVNEIEKIENKKNNILENPKAPSFFHNLSWNRLNPSDPDHIGIIAIADEIKRLSIYNLYGRYPVATAMLLRALLEQSLKFHIKQIGEWEDLLHYISKQTGYDPMLRDLLRYLKHNNRYKKSFVARTTQSAFNVSTDDATLDLLDTNIHNTQYIRATKTELENIASKGMFQLISTILNNS